MLPLTLCNGLDVSTDWVRPLKAFLKDVKILELFPSCFNWLLDIVGLTEGCKPGVKNGARMVRRIHKKIIKLFEPSVTSVSISIQAF